MKSLGWYEVAIEIQPLGILRSFVLLFFLPETYYANLSIRKYLIDKVHSSHTNKKVALLSQCQFCEAIMAVCPRSLDVLYRQR